MKEGISFHTEFSSYGGLHHNSGRVENQEERSEIIGIPNKVDQRPYEAETNRWRGQRQQNDATFFRRSAL